MSDILDFFKVNNTSFLNSMAEGPSPECDRDCPYYEEDHDMGATIPYCRVKSNGFSPISGWDCLNCRGITKEEWLKEKNYISNLPKDDPFLALLLAAFLIGDKKMTEPEKKEAEEEHKQPITNRQWLETLDNKQFASVIFGIVYSSNSYHDSIEYIEKWLEDTREDWREHVNDKTQKENTIT